jgi:hypothetical protein
MDTITKREDNTKMLDLYGAVDSAIKRGAFEAFADGYLTKAGDNDLEGRCFTLGLAVCTAAREARYLGEDGGVMVGKNVFDFDNSYGKALDYVKQLRMEEQ